MEMKSKLFVALGGLGAALALAFSLREEPRPPASPAPSEAPRPAPPAPAVESAAVTPPPPLPKATLERVPLRRGAR